MPTRPITGPLTRSLSGGVTGVGVASLPSPTHYVSQTATNGYAVGVNSGAGTSKAAPWLTLDYAIANAPSGSVIAINDGIYTAATVFAITDKALELRSHNRRAATLRAAAAQTRVVNLASSLDRAWTLRGVVIDGQGDTQANVLIGSPSLTSTLSVTLIDCEFKGATARAIQSNAQKKLNLSVRNCECSGTHSGLASVEIGSHEAGSVIISGLGMNCTLTSTSTKHGVYYRSVTGVGSLIVEGVTGSLTTSAATGGLYGIKGFNLNGMLVRSCNLTVNAANTLGALYWLLCDSAVATANGGIIENNQGTSNSNSGYVIVYGQDASSAGDNRQNNGIVRNNNVSANAAAPNPIHGLMLGYGTGGEVYSNTVNGAALATIAKQQIGGEFHDNTILNAASEAIRAKGANGTTWRDNTVTVSAGAAGDCVNINANDTPATNSTGVVIDGNVFNIDAAPGNVVDVAVGSDATFTGNTYNVNTTLVANPWSYQGTGYATLTAWKAAIEPTALP